jgi:hypothetical protein
VATASFQAAAVVAVLIGGDIGPAPERRAELAKAEFRMAKVALCQAAPTGLGDFTPLPAGHTFRPGDRLHCYLEMHNIPCVWRGAEYRVRLNRVFTITDADGRVVQRATHPQPGSTVDKPPDRYFNYYFTGLHKFRPGRYTLHVTATDFETGKSVRGSVGFTVIAADSK